MDFDDQDRTTFSLRKGDLLVCEGGEVGRTAIWQGQLEDCYFQKALHRLRPVTKEDDPRFFRYFMRQAVDAELFQRTTSSTIQHLPAEKLRVVRYPAPPFTEQTAIADFLDRETARIDSLVAAKERLLALLAEKRRALITRAVTRGLDPHVPMRDSGVPWLGEIPGHWETLKLRRLLVNIEQGWSPECDTSSAPDGEWGVLKAGCCNGGTFNPSDNKTLPSDKPIPANLEIQPGDILMSRASGSEDLIGSVALVPPGTRRRLLLSDKIFRLRYRSTRVAPAFLSLILNSSLVRFQIRQSIRGASGLANNISQGEVLEIVLPCPPVDEQAEIVRSTEQMSIQLERLSQLTKATLALLKERRSALISAAVTGRLVVAGGGEAAGEAGERLQT